MDTDRTRSFDLARIWLMLYGVLHNLRADGSMTTAMQRLASSC